jgi:hypothetical protein
LCTDSTWHHIPMTPQSPSSEISYVEIAGHHSTKQEYLSWRYLQLRCTSAHTVAMCSWRGAQNGAQCALRHARSMRALTLQRWWQPSKEPSNQTKRRPSTLRLLLHTSQSTGQWRETFAVSRRRRTRLAVRCWANAWAASWTVARKREIG